MDARVARFERANDLLLEQVYQKLALGRCRNLLHILGERCRDPQDMYHWGGCRRRSEIRTAAALFVVII